MVLESNEGDGSHLCHVKPHVEWWSVVLNEYEERNRTGSGACLRVFRRSATLTNHRFRLVWCLSMSNQSRFWIVNLAAAVDASMQVGGQSGVE